MIEPSALLSTSLLALMQFNVPVFSSYVPLYFLSLGIPHVELFFLSTGLFSMMGRGTLGRFADRVGRLRSIALGSIIQLVGLILMGQSSDIIGLSAGGIVLTLGQSVSHPSLYALVIDRSPPERRGAALATYTMGFQLGSGVGAVVFGFVIQYLGYHTMYQLSLIPVMVALLTTLLVWRRQSRPQPSSGAQRDQGRQSGIWTVSSQAEPTDADSRSARREPLWTRTFALVWLNQFLSYSSNWITLPVCRCFWPVRGRPSHTSDLCWRPSASHPSRLGHSSDSR